MLGFALFGIVVPILVGIGLVWIGLSSERVAKKVIAFGLARTNGQASVGAVEGRLRGPLVLRRVAVRSDRFRATVDSARLEWSPGGLLRGELQVDRLHVTGVHVVLPDSSPASPDTAAPGRPRLPLTVVFGDVAARGISVDAPGGATLREGEIRLAGRSSDYRLDARGDAFTPTAKTVHLALTARGDLERLASLRADAALLDGRVVIVGPVRWWPRVQWELSLAADDLRPGALMTKPREWPGALMLRARTAGRLDSAGPAGRLAVDTLGGSLRRQPIAGSARVGFGDSLYRLDTLALTWGPATLSAAGVAGDTVDLRFRAGVRDLGAFDPGSSGRLALRGTVAGPRLTPRIRVEAEGNRLASGSARLARLTGRADVDLARDGRNDAGIRADSIRIGAQAVTHAALSLRGTRREHQLTLHLLAPGARAELGLAGGLVGKRKQWKGRVLAAEVDAGARGGVWRLERPRVLLASDSAASLEQVCLRAQGAGADDPGTPGAARVCAGGAWRRSGAWRAVGLVERLPLDLADAFLPPGDSLSGALDGRFAVSVGRDSALTADVTLASRAAAFHYPDGVTRRPRRISLDTAAIALRGGRSGIHAAATARAAEGPHPLGTLDLRLALPGYRRLGAPLAPQRVQGRLEARVADLAIVRTFAPDLDSTRGRLDLGLSAAGTIGRPELDGSLGLTDLGLWWPEHRSVTGSIAASLRAAVGRGRRLRGDVRVEPRGLGVAFLQDSGLRRLAISGKGLEVHAGGGVRGAVDLALADSTGARVGSLAGDLELPRYASLGSPIAAQPIRLRLTGRIPNLGVLRGLLTGLDSLRGSAALDLAATGTGAAPRVTGRLRLEQLMAGLPHGARLTGAVAGDLRAAVAGDSTIDAQLSVVPRGVAIEYAADSIPRRLTLDTTGLVVRAGREGVRGSLDLSLRAASGQPLATLAARLALPRYRRLGAPIPAQPVAAKLDGRVDDLSLAQAFSAELDSVTGRITLNASLSGTAGAPQLIGGLRLDNGAANIPRFGLHLRELGLAASGDSAGRVTVSGRLRSGSGVLTMRGASPVRPTAREPGRIHIQGDSVEVANTGEGHILVSPRIDVTLAGDSLDARGEVRVPYAHVELSEIPQTAVPPSDDVVFTDTIAQAAARRRITSQIRVELGDSVTFKGFNFTAHLGGGLLAVSVPRRPATGSGAIVIKEGQYRAYGQDLAISDGVLRFAGGPVDNPGLDIRATRTAEDSVVAGVKIQGTLKAPQVTIFSNPAMEQGRALQYLVLGHPLGETSGTQGSLASKAASSLGLRGGNLLARSVGKGVGLDEAQIETKGDLKEASFVAGKYLSPNLYVSYGIGLFDPVSTLQLRYVLSSKWTLQAEKGTGTGADLLYRFEAGR